MNTKEDSTDIIPVNTDESMPPKTEMELRRALAFIEQGKTPPPMRDPYTGLPMSRNERRAMKRKVEARIQQLKKGKK